jgi:colanic acid biosynthesis protein WcaH
MHKDISLSLYKKIHAAMPIPCVDAVVVQDGKTLLCKRTNEPVKGHYWLPGGRIRKGETLTEAILRKVEQETGLKVRIVAQLGTEETMFDEGPFGGPTHTVNTVFLVRPVGTVDLATDDQHSDLAWFPLTARGLHPYVAKYLRAAKRYNETKR